MWGRFGALGAGQAIGGINSTSLIDAGPTRDELDRMHRIGLEKSRAAFFPTWQERESQSLGEKLLDFVVRADLLTPDEVPIGGTVYRIFVGHRRRLDDIDERTRTARL